MKWPIAVLSMSLPAVKLALLLLTAATSCAEQGSEPGLPANLDDWICQKLKDGQVADFDSEHPEWRYIDGELVVKLLTKTQNVHLRGVQIKGAVITNKLDLRNAYITHETRLEGCRFSGEVDLTSSRFTKGLRLNGCVFERAVLGEYMQVDSLMDLGGSHLFNSPLSESILPRNATFDEERVVAELRELFYTNGVELDLSATVRSLGVSNHWAIQDGGLKTYVLVENGTNWFEVCRATVCYNFVNLRGAAVENNFVASYAQFKGKVLLDSLSVRGTIWLNGSVFEGETSFGYAKVADELSAEYAYFANPTNEVRFYSAEVGGSAVFSGARFDAPANFILLHVGANFEAFHAQFANETELNSDESSHFNADFGSMSVQGYAWMSGARFERWVSFKDATFQKLYLDGVQWPNALASTTERNHRLRLEGLSYQHIRALTSVQGSAMDDSSRHRWNLETWKNLETVLASIAPYSADVYIQLEGFFRRQGEIKLADQIFIEGKRQERCRVLWPSRASGFGSSWLSWFGSLVLDGLVGYGRRPEFAFIFSAFPVAFGCWVFRYDKMKLKAKLTQGTAVPGSKATSKQKPNGVPAPSSGCCCWWIPRCLRSRNPSYYAFWYSLDQFVPIIDFKPNDDWMPDPVYRFAWHYLVVHKILGAILVPIGLAAVTGLVK